VPPRIAENTVRGVLRALPPPHRLAMPLALTLNPLARRYIAAQAGKQVAKRARREHYPAPYAILDLWVKHDGDALAAPRDGSGVDSIAAEDADDREPDPRVPPAGALEGLGKDGDFAATHVHVVGAGTMGGDIAAWCALRGLRVTLQDQSAERLVPAMKRAAKLFADRLRDPRRARDGARPPDSGRRRGWRGARRRDHRGDLRERRRQADAVRGARAKAKPSAILATNTSSIPLEDIATALTDPTRLIGLHFFNPVARMMLVEIVVGRQTREALVSQAAAFVRQIDKLPLPVKSAPAFSSTASSRPT